MTDTMIAAPVPKSEDPEQKFLCLVGIGVMHSIAPPMHDYIAATLGLPWHFRNIECPTVEDMKKLFQLPDFAGAVVTMPYKKTVISLLDEIDDSARRIGAVNNVSFTAEGRLRGSNTDWRGIKGCLLNATDKGVGKTAMIIGAGGASRAAVYALSNELSVRDIYVINRDAQEVADLLSDVKGNTDEATAINLIHVQSVDQAKALQTTPFYIVGTVPDFEPQTSDELQMREMLQEFLARREKGVLLDMCFKPRNTRILKLGRSLGWECVDGTGIIGHQIEEQWRLWTGHAAEVPKKQAWAILNKGARESTAINF